MTLSIKKNILLLSTILLITLNLFITTVNGGSCMSCNSKHNKHDKHQSLVWWYNTETQTWDRKPVDWDMDGANEGVWERRGGFQHNNRPEPLPQQVPVEEQAPVPEEEEAPVEEQGPVPEEEAPAQEQAPVPEEAPVVVIIEEEEEEEEKNQQERATIHHSVPPPQPIGDLDNSPKSE